MILADAGYGADGGFRAGLTALGLAYVVGVQLSTMLSETSIERLVETTKLRWRIERDYQDLKQELGLGHDEGRGWRGFHHHASLCIAA